MIHFCLVGTISYYYFRFFLPARCQFHQNFMRAFFIWKCFFCQNVTREKLREALLYKKLKCKMLTKLPTRIANFCSDITLPITKNVVCKMNTKKSFLFTLCSKLERNMLLFTTFKVGYNIKVSTKHFVFYYSQSLL